MYHDETKDVPKRNFKGHILLFVPIRLFVKSNTPMFGDLLQEYLPQEILFKKIIEARQAFSCDGKLHFSQLSGKTWKKYDFTYRKTIDLLVDALRHKSPTFFLYPLHCKVVVIFYPKGADWNIYGGDRKEQKLRHDETLLRILLKGAAHYLYDHNNQVEVLSIVSDGNPAHREFDEKRILWQLTHDDIYGRTPLREYVYLTPETSIMHLPSDHKQYEPNSDEYRHANFLQIADLLLGAVMRTCYVGISAAKIPPSIDDECVKRDIIAQPVKEMLDKKKRGAGFKHSGHHKSFAITQVSFGKENIKFHEVETAQIQDQETLQMKFTFTDDVV